MLYTGAFVDITPAGGLTLAGFSHLQTPCTHVLEPLEADIVILRDNGRMVAFISMDLLFVGGALKREIMGRLDGLVREENLFISATHTHFAPGTDTGKAPLGETSPEYLSFVADRVADAVREIAAAGSERVRILYHEGSSECGINRRRQGWTFSSKSLPRKEMLALPNRGAFKDGKIRIMEVRDGNDVRRAIIWNFSCHPSGSPFFASVSSDYPGVVRSRLRSNPGLERLPVVFLQGFCGDVVPTAYLKPPPRMLSAGFARYLARRIVNGPEFSNFSPEGWEQWIERLYGDFREALSSEPGAVVDEGIATTMNSIPLVRLGIRGPQSDLSLRSVLLGDRLRIVGISAEPVAEYVTLLERLFPGDSIVPVGYIDSTFGYLPTEEMLDRGGYEVSGSGKYFGIEGSFKEGFQETILRELKKLARRHTRRED